MEGAGPGVGLSFPDLSASKLTKYLSKCLSPYPSLMVPEVLDVYSLLNPLKDAKTGPLVIHQQRSNLDTAELNIDEANGKPLPVIDTNEIENQMSNAIASEKDGPVVEPGIRAEIADGVCADLSVNIHSCGVCCKTFENLHNLENHMVTHVKKFEDTIACIGCGKGFRKAYTDCQQHKKFPCNGCGKEFREAHESCLHHKRKTGKISTSFYV